MMNTYDLFTYAFTAVFVIAQIIAINENRKQSEKFRSLQNG